MNSNNNMHSVKSGITTANLFAWTLANACILGVGAWIFFNHAGGSLMRQAEAAPPPSSALNLAKGSNDPGQALDSGYQRAEMVSELRALRQEVAELRAALSSGGVRAEVTNLGDAKFEIDYAKLRDAMRAK